VPPWQTWVLQQSALVAQLAPKTQAQVLPSQNPLQQSPPPLHEAPGEPQVELVHVLGVKEDAVGQVLLHAVPAGQQ
jgi:hypothetical protein